MPKSSKKTSSHGDWSDPIWHETYQQWYIERVGRNGETEYDWIEPTLPTGDGTIPRSQPPVDHLTQRVQSMNIDHGGFGGQQQYASYSTQQEDLPASATIAPPQPHLPATDAAGASEPSSSPIYTHHGATGADASAGKGKGKARAEDERSMNPPLASLQGGPQPIDPGYGLPQGGYGHQGGFANVSENYPLDTSGPTAYSAPYQGSAGGAYDNLEDDDNAENDPALQHALAESRNLRYSQGRVGESSAYVQPSIPYHQASVDPSTYHHATEDEDDDGNITPRGPSPTRQAESHISGGSGSAEVIDPRFAVEHSFKYQPGEVLKIYWSEPRGAVNGALRNNFSEWEEKTTDQGPFYVGYRRFIVVRTDEGHSTCIPISTYEGKACKKRGVRASKHGIVYEYGKHKRPPRLLKGEPDLGFEPVGIDIYERNEKLASESRVNYSKLVTIEHNVKVLFIGRVVESDLAYVQNAVNECWGKKKTERHERSRKPRR